MKATEGRRICRREGFRRRQGYGGRDGGRDDGPGDAPCHLRQLVQPIHQPGSSPPVFYTTIQLFPNLFWQSRNLSMPCFHNHFPWLMPLLFHHSPFTGANDEKVGFIGAVTPGCGCFLLR
jgi:hypothetical protein